MHLRTNICIVPEMCLGDLVFEWDVGKAEANVDKHGITFEEAATTWLDPFAIERFDREHSDVEERWIRIGVSLRSVVLVVWSTERDDTAVRIRLIGARRANPGERKLYEEQAH